MTIVYQYVYDPTVFHLPEIDESKESIIHDRSGSTLVTFLVVDPSGIVFGSPNKNVLGFLSSSINTGINIG
jgi:hypothetical protein